MHIEGSRGADIQILRNVNIHGCGHTGGEEECGREKDRERTYGGRHANIQVGRAEGMGRETTSGVWTCRGASTRGVGYCPSCVPVNACDSVFETRHTQIGMFGMRVSAVFRPLQEARPHGVSVLLH